MKKYGDTVLFKRGADTLNALVLQSIVQADGEHITLIYLDPTFDSPILGGSAAGRAVATAFTVPFKDGAAQGWIDAETISETGILQMQANFADAEAKDDSAWEKKIAALEAQLKESKVVVFGEGQITSTPGTSNGHPAVIFEPTDKATGATVLEFHGAEGVNVLIADLGALACPAQAEPPAQQ
jgi:hypothetical protein